MVNNNELDKIITRFGEFGWDLIDVPAKAWLAGSGDTGELIATIKKADREC